MKFNWILAWIFAFLISGTVWSQDCGTPPGPYTYSTRFYQAVERLSETDTGESVESSAKYTDEITGTGNFRKSEKASNYESLTIDQATQIVQQEHANAAANIIAECGYRACLLNKSRSEVSVPALTLISQVCNPALAVPSTKSKSSGNQLSVSPGNIVIVSKPSPQQRTVQVRNGTAGTIDVTSAIDQGEDIVSVVQPTSKSFAIGPNASVLVKLSIKKSQEPITSTITFAARADNTVSASTQLVIVPNVLFLLPPAELSPGTLTPNASIIVDQRNANVPVFYADHDQPEKLPVSADVWYSNPSPGYGTEAHAKYEAAFRQTANENDRIAGEMLMSARVGGTCGGNFTEAPGGYGEVTPSWNSLLNLPGINRQQVWHVAVSTDIGPFTPNGSCKVVVGITDTPVEKNGRSTLKFELHPGSYALQLSCTDPNSPKSFGCKGTPGEANYKNQKYEIRIDAQRSPTAGAQVTNPVKR